MKKYILAFPVILTSILNTFIGNTLLRHYLEVVHFSATKFALAGSIIGCLDLFFDLFLSYYIDIVGPKPFVIVGAPIIVISSIALLNVPFELETQIFFWILFWNLLKSMYPLESSYQNLCSMSLRTSSNEERNQFFALKHIFGIIGQILGNFLPFYIQISSMSYLSIVGILYIASFWTMAFFSKQENSEKNTKSFGLIPGIKRSLRNKPFNVILVLYLYESFRGLFWSNLTPLYFIHVLDIRGKEYDFWNGVFHITGLVCATLFTPIWIKINEKLGTRISWILTFGLQIPTGFFVYFFATNPYNYFIFFVYNASIAHSSGFLGETIRSSVYDYDELITGSYRSSAISSSWRFFPRYLSLPGSVISFAIITHFGYNSSVNDNSQAKESIRFLAALLPSVTSLITLYIKFQFPIDDTKANLIKEGILKRKKGMDVIDPLTNKLITKSKISDDDLNVLDHFFNFEIAYYLKNGYKNLELYFSIVWFSVFSFAISLFIRHLFEMNSSDIYKMILLWVSSISFTLGVFHWKRMDPFNKMKSLDSEICRTYLE